MNANVIEFPERDHTTTATSTTTPAQVGRLVYTVKETAELLSLSLGSTYTLIRSGEIPAIKLGGRWAVPKKRLHEWLNALPATTDDIGHEPANLEHAEHRTRTGA